MFKATSVIPSVAFHASSRRLINDRVPPPVVAREGPGQKLGCDSLGDLLEMADRTARLAGGILEDRLEDVRILGMLGMVPEEEGREQPLTQQPALLAENLVELDADFVREEQIEMVGPDPDTLRLQQR